MVASARSTSTRRCGRPAARASVSRKLCTPMLTRVAPRSTSTASRSAVAVTGDVSTDVGTARRSAPVVASTASNSAVSSPALR